MKAMGNLQWVRLAASRDTARAMLTGVQVEGPRMACTDGHRLHIDLIEPGMPEGLWRIDAPQPIDGKFPRAIDLQAEWANLGFCVPFRIPGEFVSRARWFCEGLALAYKKSGRQFLVDMRVGRLGRTSTSQEVRGFFHPRYFADALAGAPDGGEVWFTVPTKPDKEVLAQPLHVWMGDRRACLMPVRVMSATAVHPLDRYCRGKIFPENKELE